MVCRDVNKQGTAAHANSALIIHVRRLTGFADNQVQSMVHELLHESGVRDHNGNGVELPKVTRDEWDQYREGLRQRCKANAAMSAAFQRSTQARIDEAIDPPSPQMFYAMRRLEEEAAGRRQAVSFELEQIARISGRPVEEVEAEFWRRQGSGRTYRNQGVGRRSRVAFRGHFPSDTASIMALNELRSEALANLQTAQPAAIEHEQFNSWVRSAGYDAATRLMEVNLNGHIYTYNDVPPSVYEGLRRAESKGGFYNQHVKNKYDRVSGRNSVDEANGAGASQCPTCGQFTGDSHACPGPASAPWPTPRLISRAIENGVTVTGQDGSYVMTGSTTEQITAALTYTGADGIPTLDHEAAVAVPVQAQVLDPNPPEAPTWGLGPLAGRYVVTGDAGVRAGEHGLIVDPDLSSLQCSCPMYQANGNCPHVREALANTHRALAGVDMVTARRRANDFAARIERERREAEAAASVQPAAVRTTLTPAESWAGQEGMERFQAVYDSVKRATGPLPYMTENALGGIDREFGVELEFDLVKPVDADGNRISAERAARLIGQELHERGLTWNPRQTAAKTGKLHFRENGGYPPRNHQGGWAFETDGSLPNGGEIISPAMKDTPETWQSLAQVCEVVQKYGGQATLRTGGHVHVSAGDISADPRGVSQVIGLVTTHEDEIYRAARSPIERTMRSLQHCFPPAEIPPATGYRNIAAAKQSQAQALSGTYSRHRAVNLAGVDGSRNDHIEMRMWDGSLDPGTIQAHIRASVGAVEWAKANRHVPIPQTRHRLGSTLAKHGTGALNGEAWTEATSGWRELMDKIEPSVEGRQQLMHLFARSRWRNS